MFRRSELTFIDDLPKKMVFVAGPRQCGKTTLAKQLVRHRGGHYYNWDIESDRRRLHEGALDATARLWAFDELHKNRRWRNWLKGVFDEHHGEHEILVTGSAKLDVYGRGGDSLQGRYFLHRMHPFTLSELVQKNPTQWLTDFTPEPAAYAQLLQLGGFPEPLFGGSDRNASRWRLGYAARLVREEIRDLERVLDLDRMELMYERFESSVGSVLSLNSMREDLEIAYGTAKRWLSVFERLYGVFLVRPYGPARIKAVKKEPKLYYWDWARCTSDAARFENMLALHLLRYSHWIEDALGKKSELRYFRTVNGHEVDFVLLVSGKPVLAVEAKLTETHVDPNLRYFLERVPVPQAFQVVATGDHDFVKKPVRVMSASRFLSALP